MYIVYVGKHANTDMNLNYLRFVYTLPRFPSGSSCVPYTYALVIRCFGSSLVMVRDVTTPYKACVLLMS